ncbi:hypothetical protein XPA_009670 [Xanthoria parietina]
MTAATFKGRNYARTEETKHFELQTRLASILERLVREILSWSEATTDKTSTRSSGPSALKWRGLPCRNTTPWSFAESVIIPTTHKNKKWQPYAAATAAAYARELLLTLPAQRQSVNHNRPRMEQEEESASEDGVPAPSSSQEIENVLHVAESEILDQQDPQNPYSFTEPSGTVPPLSKIPKEPL